MCKGTAVADKASRAELLSWPAGCVCSPHLSLVREVTSRELGVAGRFSTEPARPAAAGSLGVAECCATAEPPMG